MVCLPGITTAALFTAVIFYDLYDRNWRRIPGHGLFGVFATLLILFICEKTSEWVAWSLLSIPILFCFLASFIAYEPPKPPSPSPSASSCPCCSYNPCKCHRPCRRPPPPEPLPACPSPPPEPPCKPKPDDSKCIKNTLA
jgi:hypothetical protein